MGLIDATAISLAGRYNVDVAAHDELPGYNMMLMMGGKYQNATIRTPYKVDEGLFTIGGLTRG